MVDSINNIRFAVFQAVSFTLAGSLFFYMFIRFLRWLFKSLFR